MTEEQTTTDAIPENQNEGDVTKVSLGAEEATTEETTSTEEATTEVKETEETTKESTEETKAEDEAEESTETTEGAPEAYEDFEVPEGSRSFDSEVIATFSDAAKAANLSQDKAQALLSAVAPKIAERAAAQHADQVREWADTAEHDKDIGGPKLDATMATAKRAYNETTSPEFRTLMKATGLEVHPEVIRHFRDVGLQLSDDKVETEGDAGDETFDWNDPQKAATVLFPTSVVKPVT